MTGRVQAGEDRGMRRERERNLGDGGGEARRPLGKSIERRREPFRRAVRPEPIRPQSIDRDEDNGASSGLGRRGRRGRLAAAGGERYGSERREYGREAGRERAQGEHLA